MPIVKDSFVSFDAPETECAAARAEHIARLRDLLASLERGEPTSFALAYQKPGAAPTFSHAVHGDGHDGHLAACGIMAHCLDCLRTDVAEGARLSRIAWRQAEEDAAEAPR